MGVRVPRESQQKQSAPFETTLLLYRRRPVFLKAILPNLTITISDIQGLG